MKIKTKKLLNKIDEAKLALPTKTTVTPALENFLFEIGTGKIRITSTDLERTIKTTMKLNHPVKGGVQIGIPGKQLISILNVTDSEYLDFKVRRKRVVIASKNDTIFNLPIIPEAEYPDISARKKDKVFQIEAGSLKEKLQKVKFCASHDNSRPILCGVNVESTGDKITLVATDGRRLSRDTIKKKGKIFNITIPSKSIDVIYSLFKNSTESLSIYLNITEADKPHSVLTIKSKTIEFTTLLLSGDYPDPEDVIPTNNDKFISVGVDQLKNLNRKMKAVIRNNVISVSYHIKKGTLFTLVTTPQNRGKSEVAVEQKGEDIELFINIGYVLDVLRVITADEVKIGMKEPLMPIRITQIGSQEDVFEHVIMPMRGKNG